MPTSLVRPDLCHCLAIRQAARVVTQFYDHHLAAISLRAGQFALLLTLEQRGPLTIQGLARAMVMDRTTVARTVRPLIRQNLLSMAQRRDRRSKELRLTEAGLARVTVAVAGWTVAQSQFEAAIGGQRAASLQALLKEISRHPFEGSAPRP